MARFGTDRTRHCVGTLDPEDGCRKHDGHGWWEFETDWGDSKAPGLWFKQTCKGCGRSTLKNTKGERRMD